MHADAILAIATIIILVASFLMSVAATISIMMVASRLRHLRHLEKVAKAAEELTWIRRFTS
jgi:predicted membrane metal-binding protein